MNVFMKLDILARECNFPKGFQFIIQETNVWLNDVCIMP